MQFQFDSLFEFMGMSGHGPYVWFCYGLVLVCLTLLIVLPVLKRRILFREWRRQQRIMESERARAGSAGRGFTRES